MKKLFFVLLFGILNMLNSVYGQVNMQNGSMSYDIPIYNFADAKSGLATAINLRYSSGNGLKVNNRASNVGQNWNLIAGGFILRQQIGEPDDQNSLAAFPAIPVGNVRGFNNAIACYVEDYQSFNWSGDPYSRNYYDNYYPNGYMYSEFPVEIEDQSSYPSGTFVPKALAVTLRFRDNQDKRFKISRKALADREQDIFMFNINGEVGEFVIGKDGVPLLLNLEKSKYQIEKVTENLTAQNIRTTIKQFSIKDDKGLIYIFSNYELSEIMNYDEIGVEDENTNFSKRTSGATPIGKYVINKWNLTQIVNSNTSESILFSYDNGELYNNSDLLLSYGNTEGQNNESANINISANKGIKNNISSITLPNNNTVEFIYKTAPRQDVLNDYPIDKITIKYNNNMAYNYTFNYGYFVNDILKDYTDVFAESEKPLTRLCLKSVKKIGIGIAEPSHEFSYYIGNNVGMPVAQVPAYGCLAQDHWGYYTTNSNIGSLTFNPSKEQIKGLLTNIAFREPSSVTAAMGLLRTIKTPSGAIIKYEYEPNQSKDADNPLITKYYSGVRVFKITTSPNGEYSQENEKTVLQYSYINADGTSSGWGYESPNYYDQRTMKIWNAGNIDGYKNSGKNNLSSSGIGSKIADEVFQSGLSVLQKSFSLQGIVKTRPIPGLVPLPFVHAVLLNLFIKGLMSRVAVLFNPSSSYISGTYNFYSQQYQNSLGVNYARVEEKKISIVGGIGKTVYEFTTPINVRAVAPPISIPYPSSARIASANYGLPTSVKVFHENGTLLQETQYVYNTTANGFLVSANHKSCKLYVNTYESGGLPNWSIGNGVLASDFNWQYYYPQVTKNKLSTVTEKNYPSSGNTSINIAQTFYNNDNLVSKIVTQKSNKITIEVRKYYPNDFNNISAAITTLKSKNMLNTEIASEKWLVKGGSAFLIDASVNEYTIAANGEIVLSKIFNLESEVPLPESTIGLHNPNILIRNSNYYKEQILFSYLSNAVLKESKESASNTNVQLLDFGDRISVAKIANSDYDDIAYTSFETNNLGGWSYDNNSSIAANATLGGAVMGNKFLAVTNGITINRQIANSKNYKLSFWSKGTALTVSYGGNPIAASFNLANAATGWTYYEYKLIGAGFLNITNNNVTSYIDELRLYPFNAQMSSVGYDNLLRKTSESDINNRIQYYEYDGLSRVLIVRDENKNILKKYCYTFNSQQENCLDITQNEPIWEIQPYSVCEPCAANSNYLSGRRFKWKYDINPASPTYQSSVYYEDINDPCLSPPDWQPRTDLAYCEQNPYPIYTGNKITPTYDANPCSPTYQQWGVPIIIPAQECVPCNPACQGPNYKCINGICVQGEWKVVKSVRIDKFTWNCIRAWCFPDGSIDTTNYQTTTGTTACPMECF